MKISSRGFTIVELIIVITVIGLLATIGVLSFTKVQANTRDVQRSSSVTSLSEALEKYYDKNGEYPSCSALQQTPTIVSNTTLVGMNPETLTVPTAANGTNSLICASLTTTSADGFAYVGDPSTACSTGVACLQFTLQYKEESTGNIISIDSRRHTEISTSGTPVLTTAATGFTTINVTWTAIPNATDYTLQRATDSGFTANVNTTTPSGASSPVSSLAYNTTYYFRVKANTPNSVGTWSNVGNVSTWTLTTPVLTVAASGLTQVTTDWNDIPHAASYNFQYSTSSTFASGVTSSNPTASTATISGLAINTLYYFRVQPINGSYTGSWATQNLTTPKLATPAANAVANSESQITATWANISYATAYTVQYDDNWDFTSYGSVSVTTNSAVISGLNGGTTYYFRVRATATATTNINAPAGHSMTATQDYQSITATSNGICTNGTTPSYDWYHNNVFWVSGTQYKSVWQYIDWNATVSVSVATRCLGPNANSGFTWADNGSSMSRPGPTAWIGTISYRAIGWGGTCPSGYTSANYHWTSGGSINAGSDTSSPDQYSNQGAAWGDGGANVILTCYGPWGSVQAGGYGPYGPGCVPPVVLRSGMCNVN